VKQVTQTEVFAAIPYRGRWLPPAGEQLERVAVFATRRGHRW